MKTVKRTIKITDPNRDISLSDKSLPDDQNAINYTTLRIISIKTKGIDPTDFNLEINRKDWALPKDKLMVKYYLGDYGIKFIEQLGYLVLYPQDDIAFKIQIPPSTDEIEMRVNLLNKEADFTSMEVIVNVIYSLEELSVL